MSSDRPTYINQATDTSPFSRHRELILGYNGTAVALQDLLLSCYSGRPTVLSKLCGVDAQYRTAAVEMLDHYIRHGESDRAFMSLAEEITARRKERGELEG